MKKMIPSEIIHVDENGNLEIDGATKLSGGLEPIHEYTFTDDGAICKLGVLFEAYLSLVNAYNFIGYIVDSDDVINLCFGQYSIENGQLKNIYALYFYDTQEKPNIQSWSSSENSSHYYYPALENETQAKLYRHVLSLSNNSFMYSGYIVYISTSNLKVASLEDLTTLLKPSKNYIYPLTGTCTGLDTRDAIQFGSKNLYIKSFDKISYENNTWYFKDNYGDTEALDSVSDTVTPL